MSPTGGLSVAMKIRVLLANRPRMLRELVRKIIEDEPDMEVVGEVLAPVDLLVAVRETKADAVILAMRGSEEPGLCSHLLAEYPDLTILGLACEGQKAFVKQLCPRREEIADPTGAKILGALRSAIRGPFPSVVGLTEGEG